MKDVGIRLKHARENAGFDTAAAACDRFGWTYPTYSGHENGSRGIRSSTLLLYAKAFKVDPEWLLTGRARSEQRKSAETPGFNERPLKAPSPANRTVDELAKSGVLSSKTLRPMVAQQSYPHFAILDGDTIFFDDAAEIMDHDLCIVTLADTSTGSALTSVRQIVGGKAIAPAFAKADALDYDDVAIMGKIVAILRLAS